LMSSGGMVFESSPSFQFLCAWQTDTGIAF